MNGWSLREWMWEKYWLGHERMNKGINECNSDEKYESSMHNYQIAWEAS